MSIGTIATLCALAKISSCAKRRRPEGAQAHLPGAFLSREPHAHTPGSPPFSVGRQASRHLRRFAI